MIFLLKNTAGKLGLLALMLIATVTTYAQDKKIDVNIGIDKGDSQWYTQTWVWVVGAAVFILLLVALLRGGKKA